MPSARKSQNSTASASKSVESKPRSRRSSRTQSKSPSRQAQKPRSRSASRSRGQQSQSKPQSKAPANKGRASTPSRKQPAARSRSASRDRSSKNLPKESTPTRVSKRTTKSANSSATESKTTTKVTETRTSRQETSTVSNSSRRSESPVKKAPATKSKDYEFGGPWGVSLLVIVLPALLLYANLQCDRRCSPRAWLPTIPRLSSLFSVQSLVIFTGWLLFQALLYCLPIGGGWARGLPLRSGGTRLQYHCNGLFALIASVVIAVSIEYSGRVQISRIVADQLLQLTATAIAFSFVSSALLFARAYGLPSGKCSQQGSSGCWAYDFFMGRELNPRIGWFDLKFFCELRPGMIGWAVIEVLLCFRAYNLHQLTPSLSLLTAFHLLYVADSLYFERSILSTIDITQEGFGFMLVFGDLAWVPFGYTITSRYLFITGFTLPWYCLIGIAALNATGYIIFRVSNSQKDTYRQQPQHPTLVGLRTVPTGISGGGLLADGLWGKVRHPNYVGDLLMALSWSLLAGFRSPMPWVYFVNLLLLLVHRASRVESHCRSKYSVAWERYVQLVPYRFIPRVY